MSEEQVTHITEIDETAYLSLANQSHPCCAICGMGSLFNLDLKFHAESDGSMSVIVHNGARFQGYPDRMHGGIISMLFDATMTHCLFAQGIIGVTASLNINYIEKLIHQLLEASFPKIGKDLKTLLTP